MLWNIISCHPERLRRKLTKKPFSQTPILITFSVIGWKNSTDSMMPSISPKFNSARTWKINQLSMRGRFGMPTSTFSRLLQGLSFLTKTMIPTRKTSWEDHIRLDPWDGLKSLQPLGSPNRLRRVVYPSSSGLRRQMNGRREVKCYAHRPGSWWRILWLVGFFLRSSKIWDGGDFRIYLIANAYENIWDRETALRPPMIFRKSKPSSFELRYSCAHEAKRLNSYWVPSR